MTNFAGYSTSEGIYETPNIWPDGGACSRGKSRKGEKRGHQIRLRKGCNRRGKYRRPISRRVQSRGKHGEQVCGQWGSSAWMVGIERADDRERARGRQALSAYGVWDRAAGGRQQAARTKGVDSERERAGEGQSQPVLGRSANAAVSRANGHRKLEIRVETRNNNMLAKLQSKQEGQRRRGARAVEGGSKMRMVMGTK
ncbi:hypothetical protein DFH08DRAFT_825078 [Mycena albidolilacea]|uniref:Uncharacterized protein n=1 Tax=Mycena albidolilacea TaxID=1033008 RepID=A0AAD7EA97_9AGAR|nr:hypothetical protein DFH08DRAFT_825078 [Mycena albidolilacea]